jgi:hypothetical protein
MNGWDVTVGGSDAAMRRDLAIADDAAVAADAVYHDERLLPPWSIATEITVADHKVIVLEAIIGGRLYTESFVYAPDGNVERSGSVGDPLMAHDEFENGSP